MTNHMKRILISLFTGTLAFAAFLMTPTPAHASTGPWSWHDVSHRVTYQTKRPVWTAAWSNSGWFYSDGINLWDGGQVYWYDGYSSSIVTLNVRNANIERVDDIVSDQSGTTLFLQDVVRNDNGFRIVVLKNGTYTNRTSVVQNAFSENEGISSVTGRNGIFYIVTTHARVLRWYADADEPEEILLPSAARDMNVSRSEMVYNVNHGNANPGEDIRLAIVPVQYSQWLLAANPSGNEMRFYLGSGDSWSEISNRSITDLYKFVSNGSTALLLAREPEYHSLLGNTLSSFRNGQLYLHGELSPYDSSADYNALLNEADDTQMDFGWNGTSWLVVTEGKKLYRITADTIEDYGKTKDYFITVAGDNSNEYLVGGAYSETNRNEPNYPLVTKLARVIEDGGISEPVNPASADDGSNTDAGTGVDYWTWFNPDVWQLVEGEHTTYNVGAWDADGINRIEILVNGNVMRTCTFGNTHGNAECAFTVYANDYAQNANVSVNAKVVDATGRYAWTPGRDIYNRDTHTLAPTTNHATTYSATFNPDQTTLRNDEHIAYDVLAEDADGIRRIEIHTDGRVVRTCEWSSWYTSRECSFTLWPSNGAIDSYVDVNAKITDWDGHVTWTYTRTIHRVDDGGSSPAPNAPSGMSISSWFEGDATIEPGETIIFRTDARANAGLQEIKIFVDDQPAHTCSYNHALGTVSCDHSVYHQNRPDGHVVRARACATDENGREAWSEERSVTIRGTGHTTSDPTPSGAIGFSEWLSPNQATIGTGEYVMYNAEASSPEGIAYIRVYANDGLVRTCSFSGHDSYERCSAAIYGSSYAAGTSVFIQAYATDEWGRAQWSTGKTVYVEQNGSTSPSYDGSESVSVWSDHDNGYGTNDHITVSADASDPDGVSRIEILVNAERVKTCYGNTCAVTVGPFDRSSVSYAATMYDTHGNMVTTNYRHITKR